MTVAFDIGKAEVFARLIGDLDDAGLLDRRLRAMLAGEVLPLAASGDESWGAETIVCVPELSLELHLTLKEALSSEGARRWSAALINALGIRMARGEGCWRFDNRWHFLAAYLQARLGLTTVPKAVFAGLGTLDLLSPAQAVTEALREWPDIWAWLALGESRMALAVLRALQSQGGALVLSAVLRVGFQVTPDKPTTVVPDAANLVHQLRALAADGNTGLIGAIEGVPATGAVPRALYFALVLAAKDAPGVAPRLGLLLSLLTAAVHGTEIHDVDADWPHLMATEAGMLPATLRTVALDLTDSLARRPEAKAALAALSRQIRRLSDTTAENAPGVHKAATTESDPELAPEARQAERGRVYRSPVAGVALCLPLLAENRIGREFPAHVRLAALAALAGSAYGERPEEDPLLRALCGHDELTELPDRPNAVDMLFVPAARHDDIARASAGGDRLAAWLEARFAASLPGLGASSRAFLREQFFHHAGMATVSDDAVIIEVDAVPLRPVLEMAGLTGGELARADWLDGQQIVIRLREVAP